jgi:dihydroneopterin aldolase
MPDCILIDQLEIWTRVGVPDAEREKPQRLTASLTLTPAGDFAAIDDRLENTVDYAEVCVRVKEVAAKRSRVLIETLGEEIAHELLQKFRLKSVEVELRKFILPDTAFVGVRICRTASS